jgi:hypothetical protein
MRYYNLGRLQRQFNKTIGRNIKIKAMEEIRKCKGCGKPIERVPYVFYCEDCNPDGKCVSTETVFPNVLLDHSFKYVETLRQRIEREAMNRLAMIYNFRRNAFRVDDHGNYVHDVKFPII